MTPEEEIVTRCRLAIKLAAIGAVADVMNGRITLDEAHARMRDVGRALGQQVIDGIYGTPEQEGQ
jgi:hypothetical protein